ncbi:MAG: alpha/beta hydrolase [Anaerolineaceae bacterium]|nr:alpha/beta hydrolase [Anaerolineaceae bacterium]
MPLSNGIYFAEFNPRQSEDPLTIVYLHGSGGNHLFWPSTLRRLPGCRTLSVDLPGHGKSDPPGRQSVSQYSQDIQHWLDDINIKQAVLIGYGLGGNIAIHLACKYPQWIQGIILINTVIHQIIAQTLIDNLRNPVTAEHAVKMVIEKHMKLQTIKPGHKIFQKQILDVRPAVLAGDLIAYRENTFITSANNITQPICILEGKTSKQQLTSDQNYALNLLPDAQIILPPHESHILPIDEPQWTANHILSFLRNTISCPASGVESSHLLDLSNQHMEGSLAIRTH